MMNACVRAIHPQPIGTAPATCRVWSGVHPPRTLFAAANVASPALARARTVLVFRALNLGDMLCAVPALRALRRHLPAAHITLVGLPSAVPVLQRFAGYVDEFVEFPGDAAFPEQPVRAAALPAFYSAMRARRFDIAVQLHGSGGRSNRIVQDMAPAHWFGFVPEDNQAVAGRLLPWPEHLHEVHRYLALLAHVGIDARDDTLGFPLTKDDEAGAERLVAAVGLEPDRTVIVHAGARLRSRRWPVERYAGVAQALARQGWQVALTGSPEEAPILAAVQAIAKRSFVSLCGKTTLGVLAALLKRSRLLICNDTGISHVAAAVGTPSVVIASGSDVARWAPLDTRRHTVVYGPVACRPCAHDVCPVGHVCARAVNVNDVLRQVQGKLAEGVA